jgi:hypothetical protein
MAKYGSMMELQLGSIEEGHLSPITDRNLKTCKGKDLVLAVYACNL